MTQITRFEDIKAWVKARDLARKIYDLTNQPEFLKDFGLRNQIQRAAVSVMSNISEGFSRQTDKEFIQFLFIVHPVKYIRTFLFHGAGGSTAEVQSQLYIAMDVGYLREEEFAELYKRADEVARLISGFIQLVA